VARRRYVFTHLDIDPSKLAELKEHLMASDYEHEKMLARTAKAGGLTGNQAEDINRVNELARERDRKTKALLGADDWAKLVNLTGEGLYRQYIDTAFDAAMVDAGHPLTTEQGDLLARAFNVTIGSKNGWNQRIDGAKDIDPATGFRPSDVALIRQAETILSEEQLKVFKNRLLDDNMMLIMRTRN